MKIWIGFFLGALFIAAIGWISDGKSDIEFGLHDSKYDPYSPWGHYYACKEVDYLPDSAKQLEIIQGVINELPAKYDSLYVTRLPAAPRNKCIYTVVPLDHEYIIFIFHFYSLKDKYSPVTTYTLYDDTGDSIQIYLSRAIGTKWN